jgi:HD-GYP domain-containing protein (c-di-GMP phosphodiesterase class II)
MKRKIVSTLDLKEGMLLGEDVINKNGIVMLQAGKKLDEDLIRKILAFHYSDNIFIFVEEEENKIDEKLSQLMKLYEEEKKVNEKRLKRRKKYAGDIQSLSERLKENIFIEEIDENDFDRELRHIIFDVKKLATDCYNIFSVILSEGRIENYLYEHTIRSTIISFLLGKWMKFDEMELNTIVKASLLKDIGKLKTPKEILEKPGKLLPAEFKEIKKHPLFSYAALKNVKSIDNKVCEIILHHHEREDGSGYPMGLKGSDINILAKVVAIGDIFTAMTTRRVYADKISPFKVIEEFQQSAFDKLHMGVVMTFVKNFCEYYINAKVRLSDDRMGNIIRLDMSEISKPLIKLTSGEFIDLKTNRNIEIVDVIDKLFESGKN